MDIHFLSLSLTHTHTHTHTHRGWVTGQLREALWHSQCVSVKTERMRGFSWRIELLLLPSHTRAHIRTHTPLSNLLMILHKHPHSSDLHSRRRLSTPFLPVWRDWSTHGAEQITAGDSRPNVAELLEGSGVVLFTDQSHVRGSPEEEVQEPAHSVKWGVRRELHTHDDVV